MGAETLAALSQASPVLEGQHVRLEPFSQPESVSHLTGAVYWSRLLRPLGVPLPALFTYDLKRQHTPFPFLVLERIPGTDLDHVYPALSRPEKQALAREIVRIQQRVGSLPLGPGFGFRFGPGSGPLLPTWRSFLDTLLERNRRRIRETGLVAAAHADRVGALLASFELYLTAVRPRAFLDDVTVKNVLVHNGKLSGVVDVDVVCYGDSVLTLGLTRMALMGRGWDLEYVDFWAETLDLSSEQSHALELYTALYCIDFLSEIGQAFNSNRSRGNEAGQAQHLLGTLDRILADT